MEGKTKFAINVYYKGENITSDFNPITDKLLGQIKDVVSQAASGELSYLKFKDGSEDFYFPKKILKKSIISIIYQ